MSLVILGGKQLLKGQLNLMMVACGICWRATKANEKMVIKARQGEAMSKTTSLETQKKKKKEEEETKVIRRKQQRKMSYVLLSERQSYLILLFVS